MAQIDEIEQHMGGGGLIVGALELAKADVVNDDEVRPTTGLETALIGVVGEARIEVSDEVDAASIADAVFGVAGAQREGLEDVALASAGLSGQDEILGALDKTQGGELFDGSTVQLGLKVPVKRLKRLAGIQATVIDATLDTASSLFGCSVTQDSLKELRVGRPLGGGQGELLGEPLQVDIA